MIDVLILEDDPMVRDINSKFLLKINGFHLAKAAANISEAQEYVRQSNVDLVLLDIYLPKENGIDFLKWLRRKEMEVDVILITADKTSNMVQEAFRYGAVDYLIKPFTFERFEEALNNYKQRYNKINDLDTIEQKMLDRYISKNVALNDNKNSCEEREYEKGINKYTYNIIWKEICSSSAGEFLTAEEVSEKSTVARVTVRKYLEYMEKEGKVEKLIEYGKIGRPQHKYKCKKK
ncbi:MULTISPECIES: response regulator [unclassified Sedimentibacter]|uniref:response regulator n=1 Tax=unclassified Sedimentibacter TaxID=2649220 RepID=UPI0027E0C6A0|nr:response regulator [Sedimentibacter sp. MB35-C1]WMJ79049.1 response regulator [Sedimentibacter sp. MB35-C1]